MKNLVGFAAMVIGVGLFVYYRDGISPEILIKASAGVIGGLAYLVWNNYAAVTWLKSSQSKQPVVSKSIAGSIHLPKDYETYDHMALIHLRNRLALVNRTDGLELCAKLATVMFSLELSEPSDVKPV